MYGKHIINIGKIIFVISIILLLSLSGCLKQKKLLLNTAPEISILSPQSEQRVLGIVNISGQAWDPDEVNQVEFIEIKIENDKQWKKAKGTTFWNYSWNSYSFENGIHTIQVRAWDGKTYSSMKTVSIILANPNDVNYSSHKWAVFITAANFPENDTSKLGNGGLYLSQNMSTFFVEKLQYSTSNVHVLFDDGWLRSQKGLGKPFKKVSKIQREYNISYGAATKQHVRATLTQCIKEANKYEDSEVFIWIFNHGLGDFEQQLTGGKVGERSAVFLWDNILYDDELGTLLQSLKSKKTCVIVDACYAGGFADKTIFNLPTLPSLRSQVPKEGRVIISSTSKFRTGIAILDVGPLFSNLWFEGLKTKNADGFKSGFLQTGRVPTILFKDGQVSAEEAFYYARYLLRSAQSLKRFRSMQPQINDQYPSNGILQNNAGLILGE